MAWDDQKALNDDLTSTEWNNHVDHQKGHDHAGDALNPAELNNIKYVTPEEHNAGTRTIQDASAELAAAGESGAIMLAPGSDYQVGVTQTLDANHVRLFDGNGARIEVTADVPAIKLQGTWGTKTSIASSYTMAEYQAEAGPTITNLHVYSNVTPYIGTGIVLESLMNPRVINCHLFHLDTCLQLSATGNMRNPIVTGNHIYDSDVGIHLAPGGNMHQMLIGNNVISYHRIGFHLQDCEIDEPIIIGNDIESGTNNAGTVPLHYILVEATNNMARKLKIINNHFEHHFDMTDYAIKVTSGGTVQDNALISYMIAHNWVDTHAGALLVDANSDLEGWRITNNRILTTASTSDLSVDIGTSEHINNFRFAGNALGDCPVTITAANASAGSSNGWTVSNNTLHGASRIHASVTGSALNAAQFNGNTGRIDGLDAADLPVIGVSAATGATSTSYSQMSHNTFRGEALVNGPSSEYALKWDDSGSDLGTWGLTMVANTMRCFGGNSNGIQFISSAYNSAMLKNNMVYGPNTTAFDFPADIDYVNAGLTKDNLNIS